MYQSDVYEIRSNRKSIEIALAETEKFASMHKKVGKELVHLRLLSEELIGMIRSVLNTAEGGYYVSCDDQEKSFELHLIAYATVGDNAQKALLKAATSGKNRAYQGVTGLMNRFIDYVANPEVISFNAMDPTVYDISSYAGMTVSPTKVDWSLEHYLDVVKQEDKAENWDELEMSILRRIAKDIVVSCRRDKVEIIIKY